MPALAAVAATLPPTVKKKGLVNKVKRFTSGAATAPSDLGHYRWMVYLSAAAKERLYGEGLRERLRAFDVYAPVREALGRFSQDDFLNRQLYADLSVYLADDILVKVDRMAMATSLETRAPFLDADVMIPANELTTTLSPMSTPPTAIAVGSNRFRRVAIASSPRRPNP